MSAPGRTAPSRRIPSNGCWKWGRELAKYGESVYGTRGGPFRNDQTGGMSYRGNTLYIHVWDWPDNLVRIPKLNANILRVTSLTAQALDYQVEDGMLSFRVSAEDRNAPNTVIKVELDRPVAELAEDRLWRVNREQANFHQALIVENQ